MKELAKSYLEPPKEFSPAPFWWWSGDELDRKRLQWQMQRMAEGGVYNLAVINLAPTSPLYGSDPDRPRFLSEEWWAIFEGVCEDAQEIGVRLWFYDQIGFSGANLQGDLVRLHPDFAGQALESVTVEGVGPLELSCPPHGELLAAAVTALDDEGRDTGEPAEVKMEGMAVIAERPGRNRLRLIYSVRKGFDYFSKEASAGLLGKVHGAIESRLGKWFGSVIAGSFQDELPSMPNWSIDFAEQFRVRKGYDLLPHLVYLWDGESTEAQRVRIDYQNVRAELGEESFFRPFFEWHESRGLICGFDQQGEARAGNVRATVEYYADYMRTHRWYGAPGNDHNGEGKIHSSLAHLNGRKRVWIEAFHSSGWGGTLEETFDWLLPWIRAGANLYNPHAVYYTTRGGWYEWAPPSTCWRQPYWKHYPVFSKAVSRLCWLLTQGSHVCDVGVLYPTTTVQAFFTLSGPMVQAERARKAYAELLGSMNWMDPQAGVLDRDGRDFDVLSDEALEEAEVADGVLFIRDEAYRAVILPECAVVRGTSAEKLCRFTESGGLLVAIGALPRAAADETEDGLSSRLARLFESGKAHQVSAAEDIPRILAAIPRRVEAPVPTLHRRVGEYDMLFVPAAFPFNTAQDGTVWLYVNYHFSPDTYARNMKVKLAEAQGSVMLWEPLTGGQRELTTRLLQSGVEVEIPFDTGPAAVLMWRRVAASDTAAKTAIPVLDGPGAIPDLPVLDGSWESEIVQTLDNRYGDFDKPDYEGAPPISTWFMEHRTESPDEDGIREQWYRPEQDGNGWERVQATFGRYAWWKGPLAEQDCADLLPLNDRNPEDLEKSVAGWNPAVYSRSRGIPWDTLHKWTFGPKAHVPEEFLDFGAVRAGQSVHVRTGIHSEADQYVYLAVGAPAAKKAWVNGNPIRVQSDGYQSVAAVHLRTGINVLDLRLTAEEDIGLRDVGLRAYWAIVRHPDRFERPEWFKTPVPAIKDDPIQFIREINIPFEPDGGTVQIGANATCRVSINGAEIGRQGGFEPYYSRGRIQPYDTSAFKQGLNTVVVELLDPGTPAELMVDGKVVGQDGHTFLFSSDADWRMKRSSGPEQTVSLRRGTSRFMMNMDPPFNYLWRRPHPLPGTSWLEDAPADDTVVDLVPDSGFGRHRREWFRWTLPPGAYRLNLRISGAATLWVDGVEVPLVSGMAELPDPSAVRKTAVLQVEAGDGRTGGAVFEGPVTYEVGAGSIECGDWSAHGLESYSGGVLYRKTFQLDDAVDRPVWLDLGIVRGTAEVRMNGKPAGIRVWSPYRVEVTGLLTAGENTVEILVFNTLASYLRAVSPTHYIFNGQTDCGLFGPVRFII